MAAATARYTHDKTSPSLTDTSHTLSGHAVTTTMAPATTNNSHNMMNGGGGDDISALLESLRSGQRHRFLQPTAALTDDSLRIVKGTLEGFAGAVGDEQQRRLSESRKRKRGGDGGEVLRMRKVHVEGFETGQVWEQAKRIIGSVLRFSEGVVDGLEEEGKIVRGDGDGGESQVSEEGDVDVDEDEDEDEEEELEGELASDEDMVDSDDFDAEELMDGLDDQDGEEEGEGLEEENEEDEDESEDDEEDYVEDPNGLNDGFFSIDDFNKQTQWFEDQDARGDPNTDQVSDEDDIDWTADPKTLTEKKKTKTKKGKSKRDATPEEDDEDEDSDDDDGPGFGDMDLYAPEGDSEDEDLNGALDAEEEDEDGPNANGVMYSDFFAPPAKKRSDKPRKERAPKKPKEADVERAMEDVKRDLFDDDDDDDDISEEPLSDLDAGDPKSRQSAHERRQAKLAAEIKKLEAESVAKRQWTLVGEATAIERPVNSLLEEDLDFEHGGKPVPVITPEITEDIEALIKRRIIANEFDDILRRRPDADVPATTRRGLVDVSDKKNDKGLADVYEEDHVKNSNPDTYVSKDDSKLAAEEQEIARMWKDISGKLDALSSWHYKPKPAAPALSVVADVATVAMEDVQPSTAQGVSGSDTRLAPQEIYSAGKTGGATEKGETVTRGGAPLAVAEMSREEKLRRRRREKERVRKAGGRDAANGRKPLGGRAARERDTMEELKRGGVKVINRRGEVTDVQGNKAKTAKALGSGSYKL